MREKTQKEKGWVKKYTLDERVTNLERGVHNLQETMDRLLKFIEKIK